MSRRGLLWIVAFVAMAGLPGRAIDLREKSESGDKQFIVFSDDVRLRQRVASFAEEVKREVVQFLGESERWRAPIVVTLARTTAQEQGEPLARLRVAETQPGFKIEVQVKIGDDPAAVHLHKVLLQAVLLEFAYRPTGITAGQPVVDPPWWIVEALLEMSHRRQDGADTGVFRRLVEANRLPPIENFLSQKPDELGPTALAIDRALAMCLLELLIEQPDGRANLVRLLRDWPRSDGDPAALLARHFPSLGSGPILQKWWTLNLMRFAAEDRYQGLSAEETEKALLPLLQFELVVGREGEKKTFSIADFSEYLKIPASHAALAGRHSEIVALSTRANVLYRPVMAEYEEILSLLGRGKTRGLRDRWTKAGEYRQQAYRRTVDISDYLNWFEATQMPSRSRMFDDFLKTAEELADRDRKQLGPVGQYLDQLEHEL